MRILIAEHYVTVPNSDIEQKKKYFDDVVNIIDYSYRNIGGAKQFSSLDEILSDDYLWKLVRKNGKIVACCIYKGNYNNRKLSVAGSDGTSIGKQALYDLWDEDIEMIERGMWAEVSEAAEHILLKKGVVKIPAEIAAKILHDRGKEVLSIEDDGYHYTRRIGNHELTKLMVGNLPAKYKKYLDDSDENNLN